MEQVNIKFELCHEDAQVPTRGRYGDLGYDIYPAFDGEYLKIEPNSVELVPTGIKSAFPKEYGILFKDRGSTGAKNITTYAGVLDSNYRGEWFVAIHNSNDKPLVIAKYPDGFDNDVIVRDYNKAIAQFVIVPAYRMIYSVTDDIDEFASTRGSAKLGSSD
ncbi:MAG: dUTP pyrophosphatase [Halanaerobiales bacterium]